ncbi:hypothetical protein D9611_008934 [Ephemerocybe angulata]|uniref:F-box domain-containing protein n=1 Tax=Ephemerocybe angulata TaxID=980116 RepID=A0A8H5BZ93_9AGAR|nr:hypothetical protein D9611_008934 [Tulosesus angulatus]
MLMATPLGALNEPTSPKLLQPRGPIPFDVWANIARFLPSDTLKELYSVNQAFLKLSMDERYRVLECTRRDLSEIAPTAMLDMIQGDTLRSGLVRELVVGLRQVAWLPSSEAYVEWGEKVKRREFDTIYTSSHGKRRPRRGRKDKKYSEDEASRLMLLQRTLDVIRALPNIQSCVVHDRRVERGKYIPASDALCRTAIPFVVGAWFSRTSSNSLRSLALDVSAEAVGDLLHTAQDVHFASLEEVNIDFRMVYRSTDAMEPLLGAVVPFVNRHCGTLRRFHFRTREHLPLCRMFRGLKPMLNLKELEVSQGYVSTLQTETVGLQEFLKAHAETLMTLCLEFVALGSNLVLDPAMEEWDLQPCLHVSYTKLRTFRFGLHGFPEDFSEKVRLSLQDIWSPSLRRLVLDVIDPPLKAADVDGIFSTVPADQDVQLASLSLVVDDITPGLLEALDNRFSFLQNVDVEIRPYTHEGSESGESRADEVPQRLHLEGRRWSDGAMRLKALSEFLDLLKQDS